MEVGTGFNNNAFLKNNYINFISTVIGGYEQLDNSLVEGRGTISLHEAFSFSGCFRDYLPIAWL